MHDADAAHVWAPVLQAGLAWCEVAPYRYPVLLALAARPAA